MILKAQVWFMREDAAWAGSGGLPGRGDPDAPEAVGRVLVGSDWSAFHERRDDGHLTLLTHGASPPNGCVMIENAWHDDSQLAEIVDDLRLRLGPFHVLRLVACHGAEGGAASLASKLSERLPGLRIHAFEGEATAITTESLRRILGEKTGRTITLPGQTLPAFRGLVLQVSAPGQPFRPSGREVIFQAGAQLEHARPYSWEQLPGRVRRADCDVRHFAGSLDYFREAAAGGLM